jgi:hypothetical protein
MRFVFAAAVAVLTVSMAAAQTAQNKKAVAQKKAATQKGKMTYNQCVDLAYQRGFSDGASGGSGYFIWRCMRGELR